MEVANVGVTAAKTSSTSATGLSGLKGDDFMKILVAQLSYQDPLKPLSNEEMLSQIGSIRALETNAQLASRLEALTNQQPYGTATALIGKFVRGVVTDAEGNSFEIEGIVTGIRFTKDGQAILELDTGETLPMTALTHVTTADHPAAA